MPPEERAHHPYEPYQPSWLVPNINVSRVEIYKRCLTSVKAWLDRFLAWPLPLYMCLPCSTFFQLFYVLVCLQKLSVIQDPGWDNDAVRSAVDLFPTIDRIIDMCHQLRAQHDPHCVDSSDTSGQPDSADSSDEYDPLLISIRKFTMLKNIWLKEATTRDQERDKERVSAGAEAPSVTASGVGIGQDMTSGAGSRADAGAGVAGLAGPNSNMGVGLGLHVSLGYGPSTNMSTSTVDTSAHLGNIAGYGVGDNGIAAGQDPSEYALLSNSALSPNLFTSYSADAFNYFNAIPDLMSDTFWF